MSQKQGITLALSAALVASPIVLASGSVISEGTREGHTALAATVSAASNTPKSDLTPAQSRAVRQNILRNNIVRTAASKKGLRYRWGGTSPRTGFDCSGYTQWVYKKNGINLPRTSRDQAKVMKHVSIKAAKKGDLVFMKGHVGVYAGNGKMWNSPRRGRTVSLDPIKWYKVKYFGQIVVK